MEKTKKDNFLLHTIDWLITPENIEKFSRLEKYKARIIMSADLLGIIFLLNYLFGFTNYPTNYSYNFAALLSVSVFCAMGFRVFKLKLLTIAYIGTFSMWLALVTFMYLQENYFNGTTSWFFPCILLTYFIINAKAAGIMTVLTIVTFLINFLYTRENGLSLASGWDLETWGANLITDHICSIIFGYITVYFYSLSTERAEKELLNTQKKVILQQESMFKSSRLAELGEVAAGIAHEINNPLTVIQGHSQYLKKHIENNSLDTEKLKNCTIKIEETCQRITKIIRSLSSYSREGDNDQLEKIELVALIVDIEFLFLEKFKKNQITFKFDPTKNQVTILARRVQIYQVLVNLINNASDAIENETEKWIEIKSISQNDEFKILVIDSGPGIDQTLEHKALQPFYTTKPFGKGTGLGLSIANNILLQHNGRIQIEKNNGHSCVAMIFPNFNE